MKVSPKRKNVIRKEPIPAKLVGQAFIDPTYDTGFQELFDSPKALKDFLDGLLDLHGNDQIKELKYTFNYTSRFRVPQSRKIIMDAFATTGSGRFLDIEMQRAEHSFFSGKYIDEWAIYSRNSMENRIKEPVYAKNKYIIVSLAIDNLDDETLKAMEHEMVTKEEIECRLAGAKIETRFEMVDAMLSRNYSEEEISIISGVSKEEILKRKALLTK